MYIQGGFMNPNMMGMGMAPGQVPDVPTTKELWKNEKSQYRHWMILFGIGILAIFALMLVSLILGLINETSIKESIAKWGMSNQDRITDHPDAIAPTKMQEIAKDFASEYWRTHIVIYTSVKTALVFIAVVLFADTIIKSYKGKTFAKLSQWATFVVGFSAIFGVYELFGLISSKNQVIFSYGEGIFQFILFIIPPFIWFFISRPVNKIKRTFIISERVEAFKASPQYAQMQEQMNQMQNGQVQPGAMGPFGPMPQAPVNPGQTQASSQPAAQAPNPAIKKELTPQEKRRKELSAMDLAELKEVAKKLSISGYSTMNKKELIESIIRISEA